MTSITDYFANIPSRSFKKKSLILEPGDVVTSAYYLESGEVRMYSVSESGKETTLHVFKSGTVFPLMLMFSGVDNRFYFVSESDAVVKIAPVDAVMTLIRSNPSEMAALLTNFSRGIMGLITRIENLTNLTTQEQINSLIEYLGTSDVRHQELANWLGTSRETISRRKKKV